MPPRGYHSGSWCQILLFCIPAGKRWKEKSISSRRLPHLCLNMLCEELEKKGRNVSGNFKLCSTGSKFYPSKFSWKIGAIKLQTN